MKEPTVEELLEDAYRKIDAYREIESERLAHNQTRFELARLKAENDKLRQVNQPVTGDQTKTGNEKL